MPHYVALLGAINVGGNQLRMEALRGALKYDGFADVATVVASGNVLFRHSETTDPALEERIAAVVKERFGIDTFAVVRTAPELAAALTESPFAGEQKDKFVHVHFLEAQPSPAQFDQLAEHHAGRGREKLAPGTRCLHVDYIDGVGNSKLTGPFIVRRLGCRGTARNIRSVRRILETMER